MRRKSSLTAIILLCLIILSDCKETPTTPEKKPLPTINSFTATPSTVAAGDSSELNWATTNADTVSIDQGVGQVSTSGIEFVYPEATTTYTLTATNESGSRQASCTVEVKAAKLEVEGNINKGMTSYGCPKFTGWVRNNGDNTAYNASITIYCYADSAKTTLIDTAWDYLADGNDIKPGVKVPFEAICFDLSSHDQIKARQIELDWLEREIGAMSASDLMKVEENKRRWRELQVKKEKAQRKKRYQ